MSERQTQFQLIRPGLTKNAGTVSLMSFDKPGWYLRHYNGRLYLEPRVNPRNPLQFDSDATFMEHSDTFYDNFVAFESVTNPGYYIAHNESRSIYIRQLNDTSEFHKSASFAASPVNNRRRKRELDIGEIIL